MPRLMLDLSQDEFERLRDRAIEELRHPRDTARLMLRSELGLGDRTIPTPSVPSNPPRLPRHDHHGTPDAA
jgi:hypothetical protein